MDAIERRGTAIPINERVSVGAVFEAGRVRPAWFLWRRRRYPVRGITQQWQARQGSATILHLGVTDGTTLFQLALNQQTLTWSLAAVEPDGAAA